MNLNELLRNKITQSGMRLYDLSRKTHIYEAKLKTYLQDAAEIPRVSLVQLGSVFPVFLKVKEPVKVKIEELQPKRLAKKERTPEQLMPILEEIFKDSPNAKCKKNQNSCALRRRVFQACSNLGYVKTTRGHGTTWLPESPPDENMLDNVLQEIKRIDFLQNKEARNRRARKVKLNRSLFTFAKR